MESPCYKCADRYLGCHSKCSKYIEFNKFREGIREKTLEKSRFADYVCGHFNQFYHNRHIKNRGK